MSDELEKKIIDKCLRCYARKRSLLRVEEFLNRVLDLRIIDSPALHYELHFEKAWPAIRQQFFPDLTVDRLLEYALNCYRGCPEAGYCPPRTWVTPPSPLKGGEAMAYIHFLVREETPLSGEEFEEFHERFEEMLKKEPNPPTQQDRQSALDWFM